MDAPAPTEPNARKLRRIALVLIPALAFLGLLAYGVFTSAPAKVEAGEPIPDFELPVLGDTGTISAADLRGSPVVINFWASWCTPCREEAKLLERIYREYSDDGVVFLGVLYKDSEESGLAFAEEFEVSYPTVLDIDEEFSRELGVKGVPETFFIDAEGKFVGSASGAKQGERSGTVTLGPVSEEALVTNIEILLRRSSR
jgi:cytochrome c biogenesis protein CcmG/thiol:disulfide interchange protein DsbE